MTTARPTTDGKKNSVTDDTDEFTTAAEFYDADRDLGDEPARGGGHSIVWFDQATPLYVCEAHAEHLQILEWQGSETVENYDEFRAAAYRRMIEGEPDCCLCHDDLPEVVTP